MMGTSCSFAFLFFFLLPTHILTDQCVWDFGEVFDKETTRSDHHDGEILSSIYCCAGLALDPTLL